MKERGIVFSSDSVLAILAGRKTMTRRVVDPQPEDWLDHEGMLWPAVNRYGRAAAKVCPYGDPGDTLWVKEKWNAYNEDRHDEFWNSPGIGRGEREFLKWAQFYQAGGKSRNIHWVSAILMPQWASRIDLEVVSRRVERLQAITPGDLAAEGFDISDLVDDNFNINKLFDKFVATWDRLNAGRGFSFASNPYVWTIEFKRVKP